MILERLSVSGFRKFANEVEFTPDPRLTIIHAPNATGKSTLLDALYYGLLERHNVTGEKVKERFQSVGRDLTPTIEVDFEVAGVRYRLRKSFLAGKAARLSRYENGAYTAIKDGAAADDFVRELFFAEASGRGAIDPQSHLGFAHVLWSPARASFDDVPRVAGEQIRSMLGGAVAAVTESERAVQDRVTEEYLRYYTRGGALATGAATANIPALEDRLKKAREAETEARLQYSRLGTLSVEYADREAEAKRMDAIRKDLRAQIEAAKEDVRQFTDLTTAAQKAARIESEARAASGLALKAVESLSGLRSELSELLRLKGADEEVLAGHESVAQGLADRLTGARQVAENASAALTNVQAGAATVTQAESYVRAWDIADSLEVIVTGTDADAALLAEKELLLTTIVAPTDAELEAIREATAEVAKLQATIDASAVSLSIDADMDVTVSIIVGENPGPHVLAAGSSIRVAATDDSVVVDIPSVGRIRAAGTDGAAKARKSIAPWLAKLQGARERFGTTLLPELAERSKRGLELRRECENIQTRMAERLAGRAISDLRVDLAEAKAQIASIESEVPTWTIDRPDASTMRAEYQEALQRSLDALQPAQITVSSIEASKTEIDSTISAVKTHIAELNVRSEAVGEGILRIEADNLDDASRLQRCNDLLLEWNAAKAEVQSVASKLAKFPEDPQTGLAQLEAAASEAGDEYEAALTQSTTFRTQLETQANLGAYAKLAVAEELRVQCELEVHRAQTQAAAIKELHDAFERIRAARVAAVLAPITASSTAFYSRITGAVTGQIQITEALTPAGLVESASGALLAIEGTLSSGEKEQIYLATRLALAEVIASGQGRQLFVIDDAAAVTDPNRLRRLVSILEELSREQLQVIVTTADKSRYLGIPGAKHVDLALMLMTNSAA